jgi:hypothetical protein
MDPVAVPVGKSETPPAVPAIPPGPLPSPPAKCDVLPKTPLPKEDPVPAKDPNLSKESGPSAPEPAPTINCPWVLKVEIVKGRTQLEARCGEEVQFRMDCARLDLQAPHGKLLAEGDIHITSTGLEGHCAKLTINWLDDRVLLEGQVRLKWNKEGKDAEVVGEQLSVRLYGSSAPRTTESLSTSDAEGTRTPPAALSRP